MKLPSLHIDQSQVKIGLRLLRPHVTLKQNQADLRIDMNSEPMMKINKTPSKLSIDQSEAFADANLKSPLRMATEFSQKGESEVAKHVAKTAQEGNQLMKIENGITTYAQIAKQNSAKAPAQYTIGYMPKNMSRVKFDYQPSKVTIDAPFQPAEIKITPNRPDVHVTDWKTEIYVRQKNQLSFEVVGMNVNMGL